VLRRYSDEVCAQKKAGENERYALNRLLRCPQLAGMRLDRLTERVVAQWRDEWLKRLAPASVSRYLGIIQHALDVAMREWDVPLLDNVVKSVRRPRVDNRRERRISDEERASLLHAAEKYRNPLMRPLIVLALESGMRRGEMLALTRDDVVPRLRVCRLKTSKTGAPRTVPLTQSALDAIDDAMRMHNCEHVFPMKPNAVQLAWRRIRERACVPDLRFHDCRHEAISTHFERPVASRSRAMFRSCRCAYVDEIHSLECSAGRQKAAMTCTVAQQMR
jgi:integrase